MKQHHPEGLVTLLLQCFTPSIQVQALVWTGSPGDVSPRGHWVSLRSSSRLRYKLPLTLQRRKSSTCKKKKWLDGTLTSLSRAEPRANSASCIWLASTPAIKATKLRSEFQWERRPGGPRGTRLITRIQVIYRWLWSPQRPPAAEWPAARRTAAARRPPPSETPAKDGYQNTAWWGEARHSRCRGNGASSAGSPAHQTAGSSGTCSTVNKGDRRGNCW